MQSYSIGLWSISKKPSRKATYPLPKVPFESETNRYDLPVFHFISWKSTSTPPQCHPLSWNKTLYNKAWFRASSSFPSLHSCLCISWGGGGIWGTRVHGVPLDLPMPRSTPWDESGIFTDPWMVHFFGKLVPGPSKGCQIAPKWCQLTIP